MDQYILFIILTLITTSSSDVQVLDYSKSQLVTIDNGQAKIQNGTFRFIHLIDLEKYEQFLTDTYEEMINQIPNNHLLYPILKHETIQTFEILNALKPSKSIRRKKSINILGTAWKYIAGSPDHEDLEIITNNLENLNKNNNKQVVINKLFEKRINNITHIMNKMINTIRKDEDNITEIIINLQNRIRLIKEELINIRYAIQWAKENIINSVILSKEELELSINKLKEDEIPFKSAEEALELSKVNVLNNEMKILYMVKIPLTIKEPFKKIIIRPVKREDNTVIKIEYKEILKGKNSILGIKNECEKYNNMSICKEFNLVDLNKDLCIARIIYSLNSTCSTTNGHHVPTLEEVKQGVILLNRFDGRLVADEISQPINGTHVIIFNNSTIKINDQQFSNIEAGTIETIPTILQPIPLEKDHIELLSLEALKDLHIKNADEISYIKNATFSLGGLTMTAIPIIIIIIYILKKRSVKIQYVGKEVIKPVQTETSQEDTPGTTSYTPTYVSFNNLPFY